MSQYDIYTFILCLVVFLSLSLSFSFLLAALVKLTVRLIHYGHEDKALLEEYAQKQNAHAKKRLRLSDVISVCFTVVICAALFVSFAFSVYLHATDSKAANGVPSLKVVKSDSMSYANDKNTYLARNGIDNHLQTFDLILTEHMPDEFDLQLYDIVVYEQNGDMVIHRIVGIEEPNEKHPNVRHFLLQGDAVQYPDSFPVLYSQMRGIWTGYRVPFVGSFIMFLQSPAGWLCILLILVAMIATPIAEKKFRMAKEERLSCLINGKISVPVQAPLYIEQDKAVKPIEFDRIALSHFRMSLKLQARDPRLEVKIRQSNNALRNPGKEE